MKHFLFLSLLLSSIYSFGQIADSTALKNLKSYHSELSELLEDYQNLTSEEKLSINNICSEAVPFFDFIKVKSTIAKDSLVKYDVSALCSDFQVKEELAKLRAIKENIKKSSDEFEMLSDSLKIAKSENLQSLTDQLIIVKGAIHEQCAKANEQLEELKKIEFINQGDIDAIDFSICEEYKNNNSKEIHTKNFVIIGEGDPIDTDALLKKDTAEEFFHEIIASESTTQLGTFEIPADLSRIKLYVDANIDRGPCSLQKFNEKFIEVPNYLALYSKAKNTPGKKKDTNDCIPKNKGLSKSLDAGFKLSGLNKNIYLNSLTAKVPEEVLFRSIAFETRDGGLVDIRLEVFDIDKKVKMYFESREPISLLNFTRTSSRAFLHFSNKFSEFNENQQWKQNVLKYLRIRVSDILRYLPDAGNNYVPNDLTLTLPKDIEAESDKNVTRAYKLINDSSLKNIIDLRTYTDFLGLFGNESNGLFQIEGKADFYLNPFNFDRTSLYIFKKVTPFIRYSRLEEGNDFIETESIDGQDQISFERGTLQLLERSNLEFGFDLNLAHFRLFKESPVWVSFHAPVNLYNSNIRPVVMLDADNNMTEELEENTANDDDDFNFNTIGYGLGLNFEVKRLQNFGLNLGTYFKWYSFIGDYSQFNLEELDDLITYSLDAEIFYYPRKDESQSIFLRMRTFRDISSGEAAFQQIQFGYRFTLGAGNVKAKK